MSKKEKLSLLRLRFNLPLKLCAMVWFVRKNASTIWLIVSWLQVLSKDNTMSKISRPCVLSNLPLPSYFFSQDWDGDFTIRDPSWTSWTFHSLRRSYVLPYPLALGSSQWSQVSNCILLCRHHQKCLDFSPLVSVADTQTFSNWMMLIFVDDVPCFVYSLMGAYKEKIGWLRPI